MRLRLFGFKSLTRFKRFVMKAELRNEVLHIPGLTNHLQTYTHARARAGEYSRSSLPGARLPADQETFNAASLAERERERSFRIISWWLHDRNA